jgi:hypothetical protein
MSLFKKRIQSKPEKGRTAILDPTDIFKHLTPQEGYNYLRDVQKDFLLSWHHRRSERDIIGKLNTGAGKTLIGLLMLKSKMNEGLGPSVYLCPDNQLVNQVLKQAKLFNIPVVTIAPSKETRAEFPIEFLNSEAILVCTFERMFNGKSIFGVEGSGYREIQEIGSLVVDDAHTCIKKARQQCTITIDKKHKKYPVLFKLFEDDLKQQNPGALASIIAGESSVSRLVPYWSWYKQIDSVMSVLTELLSKDDESVLYTWGLIGDELKQCECYISSEKIEITPLKLPIQKIPSFNNAKHRFILSATFSNDADLFRELGISIEGIQNPIIQENQGDSGERLIIAPKRYHIELNDQLMREFIVSYANTENVVILVQNKAKAKLWKEKFKAEVITKENILEATEKLKKSKGNLMVFVNRYDGLDLEGDMCRILVIDGKPTAHSLRDMYNQVVREGSPILSGQVAQTIEQGMGRAVRTGTDYAVVFVLDNSLVNFVATKQKFFTETTREQINFGLKLFEDAKPESPEEALEEVKQAIESVLSRDQDWREFHKEMILSVEQDKKEDRTSLLSLAENEIISINLFREGREEDAANNLLDFISTNQEQLNEIDQAWFLQLAASFLYSVNPKASNDCQLKAKNISPKVLKPISNYYSKITSNRGKQAGVILSWLKDFQNGTDVAIAIEDLTANFIYSPAINADKFENAVKEIGLFLGFSSSRPEDEEGDGPDNLWRLEDGKNIIIEAKSRKTGDKVPREDIEQLLHSIEWHKERYGNNQDYIPILMHPAKVKMNDAHPSNDMRLVPIDKQKELKSKVVEFGISLSKRSPNTWDEKEIEYLLRKFHLKFDQIIEKYSIMIR